MKLLVRVLIAICVAIVGYYVAFLATSRVVKAQVSDWKRTRPYRSFTAELTTRSAKNGKEEPPRREIYAQRDDGAFARTWPTGDLRQARSIDFPDGMKVVVYENLRLKSTVRDHFRFQQWARSNQEVAEAGCLHPTHTHLSLVGEEYQRGLRGLLISDSQVPPFVKKSLSLLSPDLDCFTIRKHNETTEGSAIQEATTIRIGPPDPTLFQIPEGFIEVSPLEAGRQVMAKLGIPCPDCMSQPVHARRDEFYRQNRP